MVNISYVNFRFQMLRLLSKFNLFRNLNFMKIINNVINASFTKHDSVSLFDLILYVPSTIFQLNRDGSSWVEPVLS